MAERFEFTHEDLGRLIRAEHVEEAATRLFVEVWKAIQAQQISDRSRVDDAALILRDALNPNWPNDPNWLPDELKSES